MRKSVVFLVLLIVVLIAGAGLAFMQRTRRVGTPAQRTGSVLQLDRNGDLQGAINQAQPGDTIVLEAGAVYTGPFSLPVKSGNQFITIQSSRVSELKEGVRVSPSQAAL
ncbi:MAG TPA: hypothetical protein VF251_06185, partial [Pyrinomonadaceae bacterium]